MNINNQMYSNMNASNFNRNARYEFKREFPGLKITSESLLSSKVIKDYAMASKGKYNVAIAPNMLRGMKEDPKALKGHKKLIEDTKKRDGKLERFLKSHGVELVSSGTIIDASGNVNYWATIADPKYPGSGKADRISVNKTQKELIKDLMSGNAAFLDEYKNVAKAMSEV